MGHIMMEEKCCRIQQQWSLFHGPTWKYKPTDLYTIQWCKTQASKDQDRHTGQICPKKETKESNCQKTSHIGLTHQITVAEAILAEKEINCSPPCSQGPPKDNVPEVVVMAALGIRRCHGCKGEILKQNCQPPKDLVFWMQAVWYGEQRVDKIGNNGMEMSIFT